MLAFLRRFARQTRANVAMTFALAALPVSVMVGMGIDLTNATRVRLDLQDSVDSAALALARQGPTLTDAQIKPTATTYIQSGFDTSVPFTITNVTLDRTTITATVDARADVPANFAKLIGVSTIPVTAHSVAKGMLLEIALVLDNSYSMTESAGTGGSKISALKTASSTFLDAMFGTQSTSQRVSIGVVPFAASVRVVPAGSTPQSWLDTAGKSSIAAEDFDSASTTRWSLFSTMKNVSWGGCVISRVPPYDVDDTRPSSSQGDTLFTPWFAPDEPDGSGGFFGSQYSNNYLDDQGGACSGSTSGWSDAKLQARTCKYKGATPKTSSAIAGTHYGPNYFCDTPAITPLTNNRSTLDSAVSAMQANGNTNILEGLTWGWRVLSPSAPFTEGKAYTSPNNRKVIILMTDGQNSILSANNFNYSQYSAAGYVSKGRYGSPTTNTSTTTGWLDARTEIACANAKAQGILIYTIGFGADASGSATLLRDCASDPKYFYQPQNSSDLTPVFKQIAQSINSLRIAQ